MHLHQELKEEGQMEKDIIEEKKGIRDDSKKNKMKEKSLQKKGRKKELPGGKENA